MKVELQRILVELLLGNDAMFSLTFAWVTLRWEVKGHWEAFGGAGGRKHILLHRKCAHILHRQRETRVLLMLTRDVQICFCSNSKSTSLIFNI